MPAPIRIFFAPVDQGNAGPRTGDRLVGVARAVASAGYVLLVATWWILSLGWLHEARDLARKERD